MPKKPVSLTLQNALEAIDKKKSILPPVVDYRAMIVWKDGMPHVVDSPQRISKDPKTAMTELIQKCLDLPYDGDDPSLVGLSHGEAMIINLMRDAATGDHAAREMIVDRLLGKPQQNIKSVNLSGDLNTFLDKVASQTQKETIEVTEVPDPDPTEDL